MFTIFASLECSNIHKMFAQLSTGEINKGDIIKYYKTNYDPMLELHNNFFDKCIDHLTEQELKKNHSFFSTMIDKVKDIFSQGATYEKLSIGELGVTIDCDNYINKTISDDHIAKKKEDLKRLRSSLININQGSKRMGRFRSESGKKDNKTTSTVVSGKSIAEIEKSLREHNTPQSQIDKILADLKQAEAGQKKSGASAKATSSVKVSGDSSHSTSTTTTIKGGSSDASSSQTYTFDSNGKKVAVGGSNGSESYVNNDKKYTGSTISGMGAKFSIFYDRKITTKDGKSYVTIGGVDHLIDDDGWIHGLNIDSSDKKINYNIAYENYFDTSCESMLTFMKTKYKDLLNDFNMNKDYVHNLQIENRRHITKISTMTKESTEISLKLNSCEQKIQGEKVKKSTLYHNIKDIKRIKVDTRIKEMQITITKLETTINNYKIEITNLKLIIKENKEKCKKEGEKWTTDNEESCKKKILDIETKCKIDIDIQIKKYTQCESKSIQINIDLGKCREKNKTCENSECSKKLQECNNNLRIVIQKNTTINLTIEKNNLEINKYKLVIENYKKIEIDLNYKLKICQDGQKTCKDCQAKEKKCEEKKITIIKNYELTIIENKVIIDKCKSDELIWNKEKLELIECKSNYRELKIKLEGQCKIEKLSLSKECEDSKTVLTKEIEKIKTDITVITTKYEVCSSEKSKCETGKAECNSKLEINIKQCKEECEKSIKEKDEQCKKDILYETTIKIKCEDEKKKMEEQKDKECNESKEEISKKVDEVQKKLEIEVKIHTEIKIKFEACEEKKKDWEGKYTQCEASRNEITAKYEVIVKKTTITCQESTLIIQKKYENCLEENNKEKNKVTECKRSITVLNVEIEKKITIIQNSETECKKKIDTTKIDTRKEEEIKCTSRIQIEINHYNQCKAESITYTNQLRECKNELSIYILLKGFDKKLIKCESDLADKDKAVTKCDSEKTVQIKIVSQLKIDITNITFKYDKCEKDRTSDIIKVDLEKCRKLKDEKINLIKQLKIFIDKSFLEFRLTIEEMQLSYNSRIQKLLTIISSTKSQQSHIKIIIDSHTIKIDQNMNDKENYEKQIKELNDRITLLIKQRADFMAKLDTIDSTSITLITEVKKRLIEIQRDIDENHIRITSLNVILIQLNKEINVYQGEIAIYKQNIEYYVEMMEKYEEIKSSLEEYIKKLENIIKKKTIDGTDDGTSIDISVYIKNIDTQDKDVIYKMNNQIEKFEVTLKEITRKYNEEYASFRSLLKKCEEGCNTRIAIIQQEKNEMDEKCDKKINIRITEINKTNQLTILEIRQSYRKEIIELKKKCDSGDIGINIGGDYNFETYKKHCLVLIEKNTQDDCKAITEVRSYYNEKCIMTSLPSGTKDLTTFASSDFTDDRNAKMMKRLNSSK